MRPIEKMPGKFYRRVQKTDGCWNWVGPFHSGRTRVYVCGAAYEKAENISWLMHRGEIHPGKEIVQTCRNPRCVNPDHLEERDKIRNNPIERFWRSVSKSDGCWSWNGKKAEFGHGVMFDGVNKRLVGAHVFSYALHFGEVPQGVSVLHKCDNPECTKPDHLFLGTQSDNMRDKCEKRRQASCEKHGMAVLNRKDVLTILREYTGKRGEQTLLAKKFGVDRTTVRMIVLRKTWRMLETSLASD